MNFPITTIDTLPKDCIYIVYPPRLVQEEWINNPEMPKPIEIKLKERTKDALVYEVIMRFRKEDEYGDDRRGVVGSGFHRGGD